MKLASRTLGVWGLLALGEVAAIRPAAAQPVFPNPPPSCSPGMEARKSGTVRCEATTCTSALTVVADTGPPCCVTVPYSRYEVITNDGKRKPRVTWTIPQGYEFHGRDGILIHPSQNTNFEHFTEPGHEGGNKKKFKWKSTGIATATGGLNWLPYVYVAGHAGDRNYLCGAKDPVLVNSNN